MTENEFLLEDRIAKIKSIVEKYGEDKFAISYSDNKDSNVLSKLVDIAIPGNTIPRIYANTGIEWNAVRNFVFERKQSDSRIEIIKPKVPIKQMLEKEGYPFKSKHHSEMHVIYMNNHENQSAIKYRDGLYNFSSNRCPKVLRYQFSPDFHLKISDMCCYRLKEEPLNTWQKEHNRPYAMIGLMREERGRRETAQCLAFKNGKLRAFQPLVVVTKEWEDWFVKEYDIKLPILYYPPFNFDRTGCKGCPFNVNLQNDLDIIEKFFPNERKQCEIIWKPVYDEYRRIGYRLKSLYESDHVEGQLAFTDIDMNVAVE